MKSIEKLKKLEELADKWREFSFRTNGWETKVYQDGIKRVHCYFGDRGSHINIVIDDISVAYFSPKQFGGLTYQKIEKLDTIIEEYSKWLDALEEDWEYKDRIKAEVEKKKRCIAYSKKEIEELEKEIEELEDDLEKEEK